MLAGRRREEAAEAARPCRCPGGRRRRPRLGPVLDRNETSTEVSTRLAVGNGKVYLAGDFASVDGKPRSGGAAVDAYDPKGGRPDPAFNVRAEPDRSIHDGVYGLVMSGDRLYLGGHMKRVNGAPWGSVARVDARTGKLDRTWHPT